MTNCRTSIKRGVETTIDRRMEEYSAKLFKKKLLEICLSVCDILLKLKATNKILIIVQVQIL